MKIRVGMFYHSLVSDWNHGNAHFLRGIGAELQARGHEIRIFEPEDGWSRNNLLQQRGPEALAEFKRAFPTLTSRQYRVDDLKLNEWLDNIDLVIVHEWNDPKLIAAIGEYRRSNVAVRILFHDTHHRALSATDELARLQLSHYDGVLTYGASLKATYQRYGWGKQVHVWHEAADLRIFYPRYTTRTLGDVVWIGNWGDGERTAELRNYFIGPVKQGGWNARAYGVRYPESGLRELKEAEIAYCGWVANYAVPEIFAHFKATVHIPRRPYTRELPGIPTIRPFEALACGIPLVSAPWQDAEGLFRVGRDFLMARNGQEMHRHLRDVLNDASLARSLSAAGIETIRTRHTCSHRVDELLNIYDGIRPSSVNEQTLITAEVTA